MYALIEQNFKAITSLSIMLLMGLALFMGQANALAKTEGLPPTAAEEPAQPVVEIAIEVNFRHNGE